MDRELIETAPARRLSRRGRRAVGLIALAVAVVVAASLVYLRPSLSPKPRTGSPAFTLVSRQADSVLYDFVAPAIGWALVGPAQPTPGSGQFAIYKTVDSAKHWQKQLASGEGSILGSGVQSIQFFDQDNGLVMVAAAPSDLAYRTTDGGSHWHRVGLPGPGSGLIAFSAPSNGWWLVSMGPPTDQAAHLYSTRDGGSTWLRLPDPPPDVAYTVTFRRPSEGWIGSRNSRDPIPHVYSSSDGGLSWNRHDLPTPASGLPAGAIATVRILPGMGVVAVLDAGKGDQYMLTSFDGGASWRYVAPRPSGSTFAGLIDFQDALHWWAIDGSLLYKSSDAGQTWNQVSKQIDPGYGYIPHVLDSMNAWAQVLEPSGSGLALTADGGLHWTRASVPDPA
jgi:photosystem II stability/assembly factor-like uncharacterized protein